MSFAGCLGNAISVALSLGSNVKEVFQMFKVMKGRRFDDLPASWRDSVTNQSAINVLVFKVAPTSALILSITITGSVRRSVLGFPLGAPRRCASFLMTYPRVRSTRRPKDSVVSVVLVTPCEISTQARGRFGTATSVVRLSTGVGFLAARGRIMVTAGAVVGIQR